MSTNVVGRGVEIIESYFWAVYAVSSRWREALECDTHLTIKQPWREPGLQRFMVERVESGKTYSFSIPAFWFNAPISGIPQAYARLEARRLILVRDIHHKGSPWGERKKLNRIRELLSILDTEGLSDKATNILNEFGMGSAYNVRESVVKMIWETHQSLKNIERAHARHIEFTTMVKPVLQPLFVR